MPYENFNKIDDYQLISHVEYSPELWDLTHPNYANAVHKTKIWAHIGKLMGYDGPILKNRWINIRDHYRRSLKRNILDQNQKSYKFYDALNFLKPIIMESQKGGVTLSQTQESIDSSLSTKLEPTEGNTSKIARVSSTSCKPSSSNKRRAPHMSPESVADLAVKRLAKLEPESGMCSGTHPVDAFLAGLAPTLKGLSPYYLNLAKSKIFLTVQKYEMEMLMQAQNGQESHENPLSFYAENGDSEEESVEYPIDIKEHIFIEQKSPSSNT